MGPVERMVTAGFWAFSVQPWGNTKGRLQSEQIKWHFCAQLFNSRKHVFPILRIFSFVIRSDSSDVNALIKLAPFRDMFAAGSENVSVHYSVGNMDFLKVSHKYIVALGNTLDSI